MNWFNFKKTSRYTLPEYALPKMLDEISSFCNSKLNQVNYFDEFTIEEEFVGGKLRMDCSCVENKDSQYKYRVGMITYLKSGNVGSTLVYGNKTDFLTELNDRDKLLEKAKKDIGKHIYEINHDAYDEWRHDMW